MTSQPIDDGRLQTLAGRAADDDSDLTDAEFRELVAALDVDDPDVLATAATALVDATGMLGTPDPLAEKFPRLIEIARTHDGDTRDAAVTLLGQVAAFDFEPEDLQPHRDALLSLLRDRVDWDAQNSLSVVVAPLMAADETLRQSVADWLDADAPAVRTGGLWAFTGLGSGDGSVAADHFERILARLDDPDPRVRAAAARCVSSTVDDVDFLADEAWDVLASRLDDEGQVREEVIGAASAAAVADPGVFDALLDRTRDGTRRERAAAVRAVDDAMTGIAHVELDAPDVERVAGVLVARLDDAPEVRHAATDAFGTLMETAPEDADLRETVQNAVADFRDTLAAGDPDERAAALAAIGEVASPSYGVGRVVNTGYEVEGDLVLEVIGHFDDPEPAVVTAAIETADALGDWTGVVAFGPLLELVDHPDATVRATALSSLADLADHDVDYVRALGRLSDRLTARLDDDDAVVKEAAELFATLAERHPEGVDAHVADLVSVVTDTSLGTAGALDKGAPGAAAEALSHLFEERPDAVEDALEELLANLDAPQRRVRIRSARLVPELVDVDRLTSEQRSRVIGRLTDRLADGDAEEREPVRESLATVLADLADTVEEGESALDPGVAAAVEEATEVLCDRAVAHDPEDVPRKVLDGLATGASFAPAVVAEAVPLLAAIVRQADENTSTYRASYALDVLAVLAEDTPDAVVETVPALSGALEADDSAHRRAAAQALADLAETKPGAVEPVVEALGECLDDAPQVARWAATALGRVAESHPDAVMPYADDFVALVRGASPGGEDGGSDAEHIDAVAQLLAEFDERERGLLGLAAVSAVGDLALHDGACVADAASPLLEILDAGIEVEPTMLGSDDTEAIERASRAGAAQGLIGIAQDAPETLVADAASLRDHLGADDDAIRTGVVFTLAGLATADPSAVEPAEPVLADLATDETESLRARVGACYALGSLGDAHRTTLRRLERTADEERLRSAAGDAVAAIDGDEDAVRTGIDQATDDVGVFVPDDTDEKYSL